MISLKQSFTQGAVVLALTLPTIANARRNCDTTAPDAAKTQNAIRFAKQVKETLEAAEKLASEGISAEVIDVATLKPLDFPTIAESVAKTGRCGIVHEAAKTAGFGAEVAARCAEECMFDLVAPVQRVTGYDTHIPLFRLELKYLPSVDMIVAAAKRAIAHS